MQTVLVREQCKSKERVHRRKGVNYRSTVNYRLDDHCGNGHNTFSITMDTYRQAKNGHWVEDTFGCQHDEVKKLFPALAPFVKWHLTSTDGPMHYIANTIYWAKVARGERECRETESPETALQYARETAIWPEATLAQLLDKKALMARHDGLMAEFKKDMESLGFVY